MKKLGYRYAAIAIMTVLLGSTPFVGAAASQKEVPKRTTVKATFVKPNERKAPTVPKRVIQKSTVKASNTEKQAVSESNKKDKKGDTNAVANTVRESITIFYH